MWESPAGERQILLKLLCPLHYRWTPPSVLNRGYLVTFVSLYHYFLTTDLVSLEMFQNKENHMAHLSFGKANINQGSKIVFLYSKY